MSYVTQSDIEAGKYQMVCFETLRKLRTPIWVYDVDTSHVVLANTAALSLWQADSEEELRQRDLVDGMSSKVAQRLEQYQKDFIDRDVVFSESWTIYPNGKPTSILLVFSGYRLPDGRMGLLCEAVNQDAEQPENLRSRDALLHSDVMILMYPEDGPPSYMNPSARDRLGAGEDGFRALFDQPEIYDDLILEVISKGEKRVIAKIHTQIGRSWFDLSVKRCIDPATGEQALLVTAIDVNELKTARDTAHNLATRDQLTKCFNRNYLNRKLDALFETQTASGSALLFIDLDHFKQINDNFGHDVGDSVLRETVNRILRTSEPQDTLARLGGDEFLLLMEGDYDTDKLAERAKILLSLLREPILCGETRLRVSASLGGAVIDDDVASSNEALRRSDLALYESKQTGRNRYSVFCEDMNRAASNRAKLEVEIARAVEQDEFVLFYQPRVDITHGRVVSVEALVRWDHPTKGILPPGLFIPICEETGLIEKLGEMIIRKAGSQICAWHKEGLEIGVSINISPRQFQDNRLMESLKEIASLPHFPKGKVELEITENVLIGDVSLVAKRLNAIHELGFHVSIDDFGTGYSNLAYISSFPLNCIKIDKSFIDQLPNSKPIIDLILTLAEQIGATAVAEGVEYESQLAILRDSACQEVQGYIYSKPVHKDELIETIHEIESNLSKT